MGGHPIGDHDRPLCAVAVGGNRLGHRQLRLALRIEHHQLVIELIDPIEIGVGQPVLAIKSVGAGATLSTQPQRPTLLGRPTRTRRPLLLLRTRPPTTARQRRSSTHRRRTHRRRPQKPPTTKLRTTQTGSRFRTCIVDHRVPPILLYYLGAERHSGAGPPADAGTDTGDDGTKPLSTNIRSLLGAGVSHPRPVWCWLDHYRLSVKNPST